VTANRRNRPRAGGRQAGYLLAAAMLLVALISILAAKASQGIVTLHKREMEEELKFRGERLVRAILDFRRGQAGGTGRWPKLEELTKPPKRVLHAIPPDPLTARYDENGKLKEGTGVWQPIFPGLGNRPINPLPCDQKSPGWEKGREIVGVYSCAAGTTLTPFGLIKGGATYKEWLFAVEARTISGSRGGGQQGPTPYQLLRDLIQCPGVECVLSPQ